MRSGISAGDYVRITFADEGCGIQDEVLNKIMDVVFDAIEADRAYILLKQEGLLEHGIKHLLHLHMSRRRERNRHDWDIACDLAVNPSVADLPPGVPMPAAYGLEDGLAAEEYYALLSSPFDTGNLAAFAEIKKIVVVEKKLRADIIGAGIDLALEILQVGVAESDVAEIKPSQSRQARQVLCRCRIQRCLGDLQRLQGGKLGQT